MSVGDLHDVEHTGEFAVAKKRVRRRRAAAPAPTERANAGDGRIPIAVLTTDAALADAIHDAAASAHPVATATTLDEAIELAAHGRCGILITDQVATQPVLRRMTQRLREAEPALVVIAVGSAGEQSGLISLLSAGVVDRLMLKPVAPALAQIVLKSAAQQHRTLQGAGTAVAVVEHPEPAVVLVEVQRHAANDHTEAKLELPPAATEIVVPAQDIKLSNAARRIDIPRPPWIAVVAALLAVVGLMGWFASQRKPAIDAQAVIASNLASAQHAFEDGHALEPRGRSAFDYYNTVLALDPSNAAALQGIDQIADRFAAQAGVAIARGHLAAAIVAIEGIERVRPDHRQLAELQAQLDAAQEKYVAAIPPRAASTPQPVAKPAPQKASASTSSLEQSLVAAQTRTLVQAADALNRDQLELAGALLSEASTLGAPAAQIAVMNAALVSAQQRRENEELQHLASAGKNFDQATQLLPPASGLAASGAAIAAAESQSTPSIGPPAAGATAAPNLKVSRMVRPEYPQDALTTGAEGWVNVSMSITPTGDVTDPRVVESSNATMFNRAALSAVRRWKYEPFAASGPQQVTVRVEFRMKERR